MWSFIVPLPQSSLATGTVTCTVRTAFFPPSTAAAASGPSASTAAVTVVALHSKERMVEFPLIHSRLWGSSVMGSRISVQAMAAGRRPRRAKAARRVRVRMSVAPVRGSSGAVCAARR
jgi:hypothetical protein